MNIIAALYVEEGGCYYGLDDVEAWGVSRDARKYDGPFPVVAHPPCAEMGHYCGMAACQQPRSKKRSSAMIMVALGLHWKQCASMAGSLNTLRVQVLSSILGSQSLTLKAGGLLQILTVGKPAL